MINMMLTRPADDVTAPADIVSPSFPFLFAYSASALHRSAQLGGGGGGGRVLSLVRPQTG